MTARDTAECRLSGPVAFIHAAAAMAGLTRVRGINRDGAPSAFGCRNDLLANVVVGIRLEAALFAATRQPLRVSAAA